MGAAPKILDDMVRVAGGAVNIASGLGKQIQTDVKLRFEDMAARMDLVPREDFDHALAMIHDLQMRVEKLEGKKDAPKKKKSTK